MLLIWTGRKWTLALNKCSQEQISTILHWCDSEQEFYLDAFGREWRARLVCPD